MYPLLGCFFSWLAKKKRNAFHPSPPTSSILCLFLSTFMFFFFIFVP